MSNCLINVYSYWHRGDSLTFHIKIHSVDFPWKKKNKSEEFEIKINLVAKSTRCSLERAYGHWLCSTRKLYLINQPICAKSNIIQSLESVVDWCEEVRKINQMHLSSVMGQVCARAFVCTQNVTHSVWSDKSMFHKIDRAYPKTYLHKFPLA